MTTDLSLETSRTRHSVAAELLSSDVALYHIRTTMGNPGVLQPLSAALRPGDRIGGVKSWVEISEQRLAANYRLLVEAAGNDTGVLAVIKANAYGHGANLCAPVLVETGAAWLGVTDATEGAAIRNTLTDSGTAQPRILVMSGLLPEDAGTIVRYGLTPVVWNQQQMEWLSSAVLQHGGDASPLPIHLEIDTGMARQGIVPGEALHTLLHWLKRQPRLQLDGVMTHFASSEVAGSAQTFAQRKLFEQAIAAVAEAGLRPAWMHAGSSSTIDNQGPDNQGPENRHTAQNPAWLGSLAASIGACPMLRTGIALYGYCLSIEQHGGDATQSKIRPQLQPVMTWKTRIIGLHEVHAGDTVGYNATFTATQPMRLALLPIGYADGLRRELSSSNAKPGGWIMVHGHKAAIIGRISMNLTIVDVTGIHSIAVGDEVVVLGDGITADDHARLAHTISYEILCGVRAPSRLA
jgi:alanine racemase